MKKILLSVMALAIAAFTFTSCEDVPMPYDLPGTGGGDKPVIVAQGDGTLATPFNIAALNNFINDGQNLDKEIYVTGKISQIKSLDVSKYTRAQYYISDDGTSNNQFYVYNGKFLNGADFTADDQIKVGDSVVIRGTLTTYQGAYQINQNSVIVSLNGSEPGEQPTPVVPTGDNLLPNGDFEAWADGVPANWKSTTTASSATVSQSTDAHSGSYAALVKGDANSNKRLAYKELTLKAGTYKFSYYAKATTADVCQVNAGYVPVTDGKVGSYKYESGYPQINNTEWKEISTTFTLEAQTTVNLLVLNYKTTEGKNVAQDILVDDAALVTSDGGIVEGDDQTPGTNPDPTPSSYSYDFKADNIGTWTINDKTAIPEGLTSIWSYDAKYGMKATAFNSATKVNNDAESWLVSAPIAIAAGAKTLTVHQASNYVKSTIDAENKICISTDNGATWVQLTVNTKPAGNNWTFVDSTIDISAYAGKTVLLSFQYVGTSTGNSTWEVEKISIQ